MNFFLFIFFLECQRAVLCLPYKIRAVTTGIAKKVVLPMLFLPFKIRAVTTNIMKALLELPLFLPFKIRAVTTKIVNGNYNH